MADFQLTVAQAAALGGAVSVFDKTQPIFVRRDDETGAVFVHGQASAAPNVLTAYVVAADGTAAKVQG